MRGFESLERRSVCDSDAARLARDQSCDGKGQFNQHPPFRRLPSRLPLLIRLLTQLGRLCLLLSTLRMSVRQVCRERREADSPCIIDGKHAGEGRTGRATFRKAVERVMRRGGDLTRPGRIRMQPWSVLEDNDS